MKKAKTSILISLLSLSLLAGCGSQAGSSNSEVNTNANSQQESSESVDLAQEEQEVFQNSTPENDTDKGLKVVKLDTADKLNDDQKKVLQYFDTDYLGVFDYEGLRRTPQIFDNSQVEIAGQVVKVLSIDDKQFQLVIWLSVNDDSAAEYYDVADHYVLVKGETEDNWYMEGDVIDIKGKSTGIESISIDGTSYSVPAVEAYKISPWKGRVINGLIFDFLTDSYELSFVKTVAETILGDIEISKPEVGSDITEESYRFLNEGLGLDAVEDYLLVQIENQKNSKFNKFMFMKQGGEILDIKDGPYDMFATKKQELQFSADFSHFFIFSYDEELEMLTLDYYDSDLNKIWKREFTETTSAEYDFTKNNIYLCANNELYIINLETGEDTYPPAYVGSKKAIRKIPEGILMISESKSDGIMLTDLDGKITWKTNLSSDVNQVSGLQVIDDKIVFCYEDNNYNSTYLSISKEDGKINSSLEKK